MTETNLADAAAALIGELPAKLPPEPNDTIARALDQLLDFRCWVAEVEQGTLELLEAAVANEQRDIAIERRALRVLMDADRANAALRGWQERSGYDAIYEQRITGEPASPPRALTISEDLDGQLILTAPPGGVEA